MNLSQERKITSSKKIHTRRQKLAKIKNNFNFLIIFSSKNIIHNYHFLYL